MPLRAWLAVVAALVVAGPASAEDRVDQIRDRLLHANENRDHVMVVAHRGSWWEDGIITLAENSLSAIERSVEIGVEMVELDVQKTADGEYVVIHDETLDRTTTCSGAVVERTLAEIKTCRLVVGLYHRNDEVVGVAVETDEQVPTLAEAYAAIDGRVLMNIDIKLGVEELANVVAIASDMGVDDQIVIKNGTSLPEELAAARTTVEAIAGAAIFMPILDDDKIKAVEEIRATYATFRPEAVEVLNRWTPGTPMTRTGGLFFTPGAKAMAVANDAHIWINTLWQGDTARISGGRGDPIAIGPDLPDEGWGFWVDAGATIIQTDEPAALIAYLERRGVRRPYE